MDLNWGSMLDESQDKGKNLPCKGAINMLNKNVTSNERKGSPKLKKLLDILGQKQCNVKLEKLKLNTNDANTSMKISLPVMESHNKDDNRKVSLLSSAKSLTSKKGNNLNLKSGKTAKYVDTEVDLETPNIYNSSLTNGPSKDECKEESTICYANLPARIGSYEISVNGPLINQLTHQRFSESISLNSGKLSTNESTCSEKFPRPLSPEIFIKTFEKSSGVNKRKQRTPVKADLKSHVGSPANNIENPCFNFSSSKNAVQNLEDINKFGSDEQTHIKQSTTGNKVKNNSDLASTDRNFLNSSSSKSSEDSKLYKYTADTKSTKRKFQQASKILDSEPLSKKQKKKMVKFDPNISEVFKPPTDEEMIKENNTSLSTQVSGNEILDESMLKLLHSRNVQVTFQKPKSSKLSPRKLPVSKKNSRSLSKSGNDVKSLSLEKEKNTVSEFNPELLEGTEREKETFSPTSSFHKSSNKLGSKTDNNIFNFVYDNVKNLSDSGVLEKDGKFAIARMRTAKVPVKSILKKRSISAKPKSNKVSSNIQIENLQQHEIENNVNAYGETSLLSNEEKSPSEKASSDITANRLSNVSSNQSQLLEEGSPATTTSLLKNKVLPCKPSNRRGRPKSKNAKPPSSRPRKYCKKSPKKDLNVSTDTSENVEDSGSDSDDNMPIIYFQNSKAEALQEKTSDNNVSDDAILLPGYNEVLKNAKGKKKRGRGRKRQKIGRPKSIKVKDDVDADSSFVEEDDEEEQVIAAAAQSQAKRKHQKRTGRRYSVTGNWYIATGYLNDIMSLLEEFENCDGWRFKDFSKCWQKKSFSLVYRGRQTFKELLEFSEEIALLTMRFIGPSHSTKRRIGALYTLYGLYYKFPVGHFFKIRFELGEYKNLLELVHPFRSNVENPDPAYIFRKLELKGAILHCATACEPCYDFHNEERDLVDLEYGKQKLAKSSAVNIAVPKIQLDADSELLTYYHSVKAKLTGKGTEPEPERALSLISSEFLQTIFSDLSEMRKRTLSELGMTAKATINSSTQGGENSNQDETDEKRIHCLGEGISRTDELDCYLHPVEGNVLRTVNTGAQALKSLECNKNIIAMRDKSVQDFMKSSILQDIEKPLELAKKIKKTSSDVDFSLNLNDIKLTPAENGVADITNQTRVNLKATDLHDEAHEALLPHPCPRKRRRGSKRSVILMHAAKPRSRMSKNTLYNPCSTKSLVDDKIEVAKPNTNFPGVSSTSLQIDDIPIITAHKAKDIDAVDITVTLTCGEEIKKIKVKVRLSNKKLEEIQQDPVRLQKFKAGLEPLVKLSLNCIDRNRLWLIQDIEPCYQIKLKGGKKSPVKPICFKQRFECLKQDSPVSSTDSESSSDESSEEVTPKRISKSKIDEDYIPFSDDEEYQKEADKLLDEEFDKEDPYESDISSPDEYGYPHRRGRRPGYSSIIERGPFDSDKLITPKGPIGSIRMVPINVGGRIRYFPMKANNESEDKKEKSEGEESNKENIDEDMNTWNNFTSSTSPPLSKRRISRSGIELGSSFSKVSPLNPRMSYILNTTTITPYGNYQGHRKISIKPISYPIQREKSFKEFFKKITRHIKTQPEDDDNDYIMENHYSDHDNASSDYEEFSRHISSDNENTDEVAASGLIEHDFNSQMTISKAVSSRSSSFTTLRETQSYSQLQENNLNFQQEKSSSNFRSLEQVSNIVNAVPKIEAAVSIIPTIKKEFSHTVEDLVEDWDEEEQVTNFNFEQPSLEENTCKNLKLEKHILQSKIQLKQEPLEEDSEEVLSIPDLQGDMSLQSDIESNLVTCSLDTTDSVAEVEPSSEIHKVSQTSEYQNLLQTPTVPESSIVSLTQEILDNRISEESNPENLNLPSEEQFISAEDIKNILYCKVKSSDGADVFVPVTILSDIKSEIEVLSIQSSELKLSSSQLKSPVSLPILAENCVDDNRGSNVYIAATPYVGSSQVNVHCSSQLPINSVHVESKFNSPSTSHWECQKPLDYGKLTSSQISPIAKLPLSKPFQNQSACSSYRSTNSPCSSANYSPMSTSSSVSSISKVSESLTVAASGSPTVAASGSKCSFFFSPKLKCLTSKKIASGRPPCPIQKTKPLVKFMFKGSSWIKSSKRY